MTFVKWTKMIYTDMFKCHKSPRKDKNENTRAEN